MQYTACHHTLCTYYTLFLLSQWCLLERFHYQYMYICVMSCTHVYMSGCVVGTEVSTRMVSEYKSKLQIAESENTRLEGTVSHFNACIHV